MRGGSQNHRYTELRISEIILDRGYYSTSVEVMDEQVTRYYLEGEPQEAEMVECSHGDFVKYEDYEKVLNNLKEAKIKVKDFLMWINKTENIGSSEEEICEMAEKLTD